MKNTGFGVSEYSFVIPEVGMSGLIEKVNKNSKLLMIQFPIKINTNILN